jgi:hypothetical protein
MRSLASIVIMLLVLSVSMSAKWPPWDQGAKTYTIHVPEPAIAGDILLNAGEYRVAVEDSKVVFIDTKNGKRYEAPVAIETAEKKFASTTLTTSAENGTKKITRICLGGTTTRVEFP